MVRGAFYNQHGDGLLNPSLRLQSVLHEGSGSQTHKAVRHLPLHYTFCDTASYRSGYLYDISPDYHLATLYVIGEGPLNLFNQFG